MNAFKTMKQSLAIIISFSIAFFCFTNQAYAQHTNEDFKIKKVVIDAGHGGKDPGAVGAISYEKDITLNLALKLGAYINENLPDVEVIYTRDKDVFVELYKRAQIANQAKADLFISIHINAAATTKAYGAETFAMGLHVSESNLAVAKKENSVILKEDDYETNYEGFDPSSPESHIMFAMYQNAYLDQSLNLAALIQDQFTNRVGRHNRGVKQAGFLVLHKVAMPSILIEAGFISNPDEERFLSSEEGITYMASAMYRAFRDYKKAFEADNLLDNEQALEVMEDAVEGNDPELTTNISEQNQDTKDLTNIKFPKPDKKEESVVFRIQIGASSEPCKNLEEKYPNLSDLWEYYHMGLYKHTVGKTSDYDAILDLQKQIQSAFNDCFIVAFKDNERITIKEALTHKENK
jgi:N-acetylmuramoyl-L-alanine amidase